jgi:hypothetical protein
VRVRIVDYTQIRVVGDKFSLFQLIALEQLNAPEGRVETLKAHVLNGWLEEIGERGVNLPEGDMRDLLAVDSTLNAQGLDVWLQRLAKAKT